MFTNTKLSKAIRLAAMFGAASATAFSANVVAQEEAEAQTVERVTVTGSRLKRSQLESSSPITTITAVEMEVQGIQDVGQFLQNSAAMSGSPAMTTTNNGGSGGTFIELRGLGSGRTLVLVNGRRPVSSDFQSIPSSMIERIDVLKDGASATYGADAVAGVVNIITKKDFEGVDINFQTGNSVDVDANSQTSFSVVAGKSFDEGHITVGVDYVEQDPVYQGDTSVDFFQNPWVIYGTAAEQSFYENGLIGEGPDANTYFLGSGSVPCGNFYLENGSNFTNDKCDGGIATLGDMRAFTDADTYNYNPVNYLQTPYTKLNMFVDGSFTLNDHATVYLETRLNIRESRQELAAVPYDTRFDPAYEGITPDGTAFTGVSKDNFYNPFGEDVTRSRRRMLEGGRSFEQDVLRVQQVIGVEGDLDNGYYYDVNYNIGVSQTASTDFGQFFGPNLSNAMGPSFQDADGNIVCGTAEEPIPGCVSMNVFGGPGSVTQEMLDYVSAPLIDSGKYTLQTLTGFFGGDFLELPAGALSGGFGYEYRREELESVNDSGKYMEAVTGNKSKGLTGSFEVNSVFAEFRVPILSDVPLVQSLDANIGVRHDDFSAFDSASTYQLGLEWNVSDDLLVRATHGTVFRAPGIGSLYAPAGDSFPSATDPCSNKTWADASAATQANCIAAGVPAGGSANTDAQQRASVGGNPDLNPEEGETFTVGFAYSPEFFEGFGITVDYWSIELDDVISGIGANDALKGCYNGGVAALCENIIRQNGEIVDIIAKATNLTQMTAKGVDTEFSYSTEAFGGDINLNLSWTRLLERQNEEYNSSTLAFEMESVEGRFSEAADTTYAEDKLNFRAGYSLEDLSVNYAAYFISGVNYEDLTYWGTTPIDADNADLGNHQYPVDSFLYHDITVSYSFKTDTTVSLGVTNITDEQPPYIEPAFNGNTDESTYRLFGQSWFFRINQKF